MAQTDILEYLRKTPHNTNVNVVKTMLNAEGGGGSSDFPTPKVTITLDLHSVKDSIQTLIVNNVLSYNEDSQTWDAIVITEGFTDTMLVEGYVTPYYNPSDEASLIATWAINPYVEGEGVYVYVVTNAVNCSYDDDFGGIVVTDKTKPCSCTITFTI